MLKITLFILKCLLILHGVYGQSGDYSIGSRSAAMGSASAAVSDIYGIFNNPASLASVNEAGVFASYENRYRLEDFQTMGAGISVPVSGFSIGAGFYRFGGKLYNEQLIGLKASHKAGFMSLGAGVNYVQYNIEGLGTRGATVLELGGVAELNKKAHFGAHIYNLTQSRLVRTTGERVPTVMKLGLSLRPLSTVMLNIETSKDISNPAMLRAGMEYAIIPQLALRTGFSTSPFISCFGVGFKPGNLQVDYAFRNDARLGELHQMSISYAFKKDD